MSQLYLQDLQNFKKNCSKCASIAQILDDIKIFFKAVLVGSAYIAMILFCIYFFVLYCNGFFI